MADRRSTPLEVRLLWIATLAAMAASWTHLVSWIASWEYAGASSWIIAAIAATAVDLGILASMRSLDVLASRREDASGPRRTVYMLACVSFAANVLHALDARATRVAPLPGDAGWGEVATRVAGAVLVAGVLPLIVVRLSHLLDRMTRLDAGTVAQKPQAKNRAARPRRWRWPSWVTHLRRTPSQVPQATVAPAMTQPAAQMTQAGDAGPDVDAPQADAPLAVPMSQAGDAPAEGLATQDGAARDTAVKVRDAARVAPTASRRALAKSAGVSDATVRRLERDGVLTWTDAGWTAEPA